VKNFDRRFFRDDELFAIALAIPALFAAARCADSEREKNALARLREARTAFARSETGHAAKALLRR
jgi:hypothetical protein